MTFINLDKKFPLNGRNLQVGVDDHCDALLLVNKLFSNLLFSIFFRPKFFVQLVALLLAFAGQGPLSVVLQGHSRTL